MLNLTVAVTRNLRFEPLIDGTITSKILNLQFVVTTPPELFYRAQRASLACVGAV